MVHSIDILFVEHCPNYRPTVDLARQVIEALGAEIELNEIRVESDDVARRLRFPGSPTVLVDGVDIEAAARSRHCYGVACRTYEGSGIPPRRLLEEALRTSIPGLERGK